MGRSLEANDAKASRARRANYNNLLQMLSPGGAVGPSLAIYDRLLPIRRASKGGVVMEYDFVYTSKPINAEAAKVLQKGEHYESKKKINQVSSENPITTTPFPGPKSDDLTGRSIGRLTVIGYRGGGSPTAKKCGCLWVVRCACGRYETRRTKAIKNVKNDVDCCQYCREIQDMKRKQFWKETGIDTRKR